MTAEIATTIPEPLLATIWSWFAHLPERVKKHSGCNGDRIQFFDGVNSDLKVLVFDDGSLLGFVTCEPKGDGIFDVHLFCPRHVPTDKLTQAIDTFFEKMRNEPVVKKLLFSVRSLQSRLGQIVIENGACFTGWSYYEQGEVFRCLVWEK